MMTTKAKDTQPTSNTEVAQNSSENFKSPEQTTVAQVFWFTQK